MKHSLVKDTIIQTASDLFYKQGYNLTGINEIISEAGIAKATLYNHFKSKEDICIAYLEHKNVQFLIDLKTFIDDRPAGRQKLTGLFDFLQAFFDQDNFNGCWCVKTIAEIPMSDEKIRSEIQRHKLDFIAFIKLLIAEHLPQPSEIEDEVLAKQVYLLYECAVSESHLYQDSWPIDTAKSLCEKIIN